MSKYDYYYDDDTFPTDASADVEGILKEHGDVYFIQKPTITTDGDGNTIDITNATKRIFGMFQDITIKDRKIHSMGLAVPGSRKFYFMPSYSITTGGVAETYELVEDDIITDSFLYDSTAGTKGQWRVVKILRQWYEPDKEIYRVVVVENINMDGS